MMARTVADVMTRDPATIERERPVSAAAQLMRDADCGDVLVLDNGTLTGIITDRDIAVRVVAEGKSVDAPVGDVHSGEHVHTVGPDTSLVQAVQLMRTEAVRRLPVVENGRPVGVVAIGDLAIERDENSALADISVAEPNI